MDAGIFITGAEPGILAEGAHPASACQCQPSLSAGGRVSQSLPTSPLRQIFNYRCIQSDSWISIMALHMPLSSFGSHCSSMLTLSLLSLLTVQHFQLVLSRTLSSYFHSTQYQSWSTIDCGFDGVNECGQDPSSPRCYQVINNFIQSWLVFHRYSSLHCRYYRGLMKLIKAESNVPG